MTVGTLVMTEWIGAIVLVTSIAVYLLMPAFQEITREVVVERFPVLYRQKGGFDMTPCTIGSKFSLVNVLMTWCAIIKIETGELLKFNTIFIGGPVASFAFHCCMLSCEQEISCGMVKSGRRTELVLIVTGGTIGRQRSAMGILVAIDTVRTQPKVCSRV